MKDDNDICRELVEAHNVFALYREAIYAFVGLIATYRTFLDDDSYIAAAIHGNLERAGMNMEKALGLLALSLVELEKERNK